MKLVRILAEILEENAGDVGVALKTDLIDEAEDAIHLAMVVDVFRENIFVERIARGTVDEEATVLAMHAGPLGQEVPAGFLSFQAFVGRFELGASPKNGAFGGRIESVGIEHGPLIVIAEDDDRTF